MGRGLTAEGYSAIHWLKVGNPSAPDAHLLEWAKQHKYIVFTHDLDFGAFRAASKADGPSVIQLRTADVTPEAHLPILLTALKKFEIELISGVLISIDPSTTRARILPLR